MSIESIKARLEACPWPGELAIFHDNYDRSTWCVFPVEHGEPSEQVPSGVYIATDMPVASDMEREWAEWFVSAPTDLRALLKVAEAAKVIDDAMPAAYGIMKMWVVVEYMEDLRAALTELEAQE